MEKGHERSLRMLSTALEMEMEGKVFYEKAVASCRNQLGREMFRILMKDELIHMDRILKIYESLRAGEAWSDEWKSTKPGRKEISVLFKEMAAAHGTKINATTGDLEALDAGIDLESRAVAFYQENLSKATDSVEQEFIERMIMEEKSHHAALSDMKLYLSDPAAWFVEQEHTVLDGA
ncbi:MAG: ferritin family protein [Desulfobacterales bacterium]|nr:ferritin family protein [Desulfobacterales bacterium]